MKKTFFLLILACICVAQCHNVSRVKIKVGGDGFYSIFGSDGYSNNQSSNGDGKADTTSFNAEEYSVIVENKFLKAISEPQSTFSIDVDNASYTNLRRMINSDQIPPGGAIRLEEMINYFDYDYNQPTDGRPFAVNTELSSCPWNAEHQLVLVALQGKNIETKDLTAANFVFLVDVSGSMSDENKLPLVKDGLKMMANALGKNDRVAIVTYAGDAGVALESTSCDEKSTIINTINKLESGGSTQGSAGIKRAYEIAHQHFITGGNNRVILCSDGDFNVGVTSESELVSLIEEERKTGVSLTVCGFGYGNYKDNKMEKLADNGNGAYFYIDRYQEAHRVFVQGLRSNMFTIASDVKIQVEFNPVYVDSYRLIGYENRVLQNRDFSDDSIDAGEIGAGHTVTALYEIVPATSTPTSENFIYQTSTPNVNAYQSGEMMTVSLRYKEPGADTSELFSTRVKKDSFSPAPSGNLAWAASVASFGMVLRNSDHKGDANPSSILTNCRATKPELMDEYKTEFMTLVEKADKLLIAKR